jgi:hypothetical protein
MEGWARVLTAATEKINKTTLFKNQMVQQKSI